MSTPFQVEVLWVVMLCSVAVGYQRFGVSCCLHCKVEVTSAGKKGDNIYRTGEQEGRGGGCSTQSLCTGIEVLLGCPDFYTLLRGKLLVNEEVRWDGHIQEHCLMVP
jgi:hypothetical protein